MKANVKRRKRKLNIYICILKERHNEYVEIIAKNLDRARQLAIDKHLDKVDFIYKAQRHSGSNLKKIETITDIPVTTGDQNTD